MDQAQPIRIGAVSYLNTKPLVFGLDQRLPQAEIIYDLPSRLADDLAAGQLDVALIPSIEYLRNRHCKIISNACIACRGPVLSVKLLSRVPMDRIRSLALDEGSRTSAVLAQILLKERFQLRPALELLPIGTAAAQAETDAVLVIGDRAIAPAASEFVGQWDLGEQWCRWADRPFVFAMWVVRADLPTGGLADALSAARDSGVANLAAIATRESQFVPLTAAQCLSYLRDNLHFHLGPRERSGLDLFFQHANRLELVPT